MKKELDEALCRDFPLLYRDRFASMRTTCMCWGFPGDGWEPLIRELSGKLETLIKKYIEDNEPLNCECGCRKDQHTVLGKCENFFLVPYFLGSPFKTAGGWMWKPQTLRDRWNNFKKKAKFYLTVKPVWTVTRWINSFLQFLYDRFDVHKRVDCSCEKYSASYPCASQVKEKFGTLRFYMTSETEEMSAAIREAEHKSAETCEDCGSPGVLRRGGWVLTQCDKCAVDRSGNFKEPYSASEEEETDSVLLDIRLTNKV